MPSRYARPRVVSRRRGSCIMRRFRIKEAIAPFQEVHMHTHRTRPGVVALAVLAVVALVVVVAGSNSVFAKKYSYPEAKKQDGLR